MSGIKKRSISLNGHRTSYSIEDEFQEILLLIAAEQSIPLAQVIAKIDASRGMNANLSSALRIAALAHVRSKVDLPPIN
jgi:predicted DNA-binding ribbon-helix-helix protein